MQRWHVESQWTVREIGDRGVTALNVHMVTQVAPRWANVDVETKRECSELLEQQKTAATLALHKQAPCSAKLARWVLVGTVLEIQVSQPSLLARTLVIPGMAAPARIPQERQSHHKIKATVLLQDTTGNKL